MKLNKVVLPLFAFFLFLACGSKESVEEKAASKEQNQQNVNARVYLSQEQQRMAGIKLEIVRKQPLTEILALPGRVGLDERRVAHLTARIPGRVEKVYAFLGDHTKRDELLATIYSPEYLSSQAEFIQAEERTRFTTARGDSTEIRMARSIAESARQKLLVIGTTEKDLLEIASTRIPKTLLEVRAPLAGTIIETRDIQGHAVESGDLLFHLADISRLWIIADVSEKDLSKIKTGLSVTVHAAAYPNAIFAGRLTTIYDMLDEISRTVKVRIEIENPSGLLKPQMFCEARVLAEATSAAVAIPAESIVKESEKTYIFIALNDSTFERREVYLGAAGDSLVEVRGGVQVGEKLVTKGVFQMKSELLKEAFAEEE